MSTAPAKARKPRKKTKPQEPSENEKVKAWRREAFEATLKETGSKYTQKQLDALVISESSWYDLKKLLSNGCDTKTAVKILV